MAPLWVACLSSYVPSGTAHKNHKNFSLEKKKLKFLFQNTTCSITFFQLLRFQIQVPAYNVFHNQVHFLFARSLEPSDGVE